MHNNGSLVPHSGDILLPARQRYFSISLQNLALLESVWTAIHPGVTILSEPIWVSLITLLPRCDWQDP